MCSERCPYAAARAQVYAQGVGQMMRRLLKIALLTLPLVAAGWFFGAICRRMEANHLLLVFAGREGLPLLGRLVLALAVLALACGIVSLLFRPLWIAAVALLLSGLALFFSWGVTVPHVWPTLLFVVAALSHAAITQSDVRRRIRFTVASVAASQLGFIVVLLSVAVMAFYMGAASHIQEEGFSVPERYSEQFAERLATRAAAPFPSLIQEQVYDTVRSRAAQSLTEELRRLMEPVAPHVPIMAALALFLLLLVVCYALSWLILPILWLVFVLFKAVGVTRIAAETMEVQRVVLS